MNRFKAKFYEGEAAEGLSKEERRERLKVYIDNVYAALPPNVRRTMPQIREDAQYLPSKRNSLAVLLKLMAFEESSQLL